MKHLIEEARAFGRSKAEEVEEARRRVAMQLLCGIDLADAAGMPPDRRAQLIRHLERLIERERLKGMRRHWSYDLNRHIALKQVLDRLRGGSEAGKRAEQGCSKDASANENGARRRRCRNRTGKSAGAG